MSDPIPLMFVDPAETDPTYRDAASRFWPKVAIAAPDECWEWQAGKFAATGYGMFDFQRRSIGAHRFAALLTFGPSDLHVLHSCDNPPCVNPRHLRYGDHAENMADRRRRGGYPRGASHPNTKLTEAEVVEMRRIYDAGAMGTPKLARRFGVAQDTAFKIVKRQTWRHIP